jgi:hypothetical protein
VLTERKPKEEAAAEGDKGGAEKKK